MPNLLEIYNIRLDVYVIQIPTYNLIVQNRSKFVTLFQIVSILLIQYFTIYRA